MKKFLGIAFLSVAILNLSFAAKAENRADFYCKLVEPSGLNVTKIITIDLDLGIIDGTHLYNPKIYRVTNENIYARTNEFDDGFERRVKFNRYTGELTSSMMQTPPFHSVYKCEKAKKLF